MDPQANPVAPNPEAEAPLQPVQADFATFAEQRLPIKALTEWVTLLQGPIPNLFKKDHNFEREWQRLFRLGSLVLLMLGTIIVIFSLGVAESGKKWSDFTTKLQYFSLILVIGGVVAVPYAFLLAPLLRIRINFVQTFFTVLLLGLPWLPLLALVWALGIVWKGGLFVVVLLYIFFLVPLYNFCKGVSMIASCRTRRVVLSLVIPAVLALSVFVANFVW